MDTKGLLKLSIVTLLGLGVLIALGTWQLERRQWKHALVERIAARLTAEPVSLARAMTMRREGGDIEYLRVRFEGRFLHGKERRAE